MFLLKNIIFKLFGSIEKINDTYKDQENKGIFERYNESLAEDYDAEIGDKLNNLVGLTIDPRTAESKFIVYLEQLMGVNAGLFPEEDRRRKFLQLVNNIYQIKGTIRSYQTMLKWLGFTNVYIIEHDKSGGFDSSETFDSSRRTFDSSDSGCGCAEYSIQLEGDVLSTDTLISQIFNIIEFNEPITAKLRSLTFNGKFLTQKKINIRVSDGTDGYRAGDLIYDNSFDPSLILRIATKEDEPTYLEGDLIISGQNANKYRLTSNGDLIYTQGDFYFNSAIKLNSAPANQFIEYPHISGYNLNSDSFSLSFWIKVDQSGKQIIASKSDTVNGFEVYCEDGFLTLKTLSDSNWNIFTTNNSVVDNTWKWVLISCEGIGINDCKVYVDNEEKDVSILTNDQLTFDLDNSNSFYIGRSGSEYGLIAIDSFIFKKGLLTDQQRLDYYNYGEGSDEVVAGIQNMLLRSNFDELTGITIFDQSDNLNHGILQNGLGDSTNRIIH